MRKPLFKTISDPKTIRERDSERRRGAGAVVVAAGMMLAACANVRAATYTWQAAPDNWSAASSWGGIVPASSDTAYIVNGGTATINQRGEACGSLWIGNSGSTGSVQMTDGGLTAFAAYGSEIVGYSGAGSFTQSGGDNSPGGELYVGYFSSGAYTLSGGNLYANTEYVGYHAQGIFNQSGGMNTVGTLCVLDWSTPSTYNLSGSGSLSANRVSMGSFCNFNQSGGSCTIGSLLLGDWAGHALAGYDTYNLSGSGYLSAQSLYVGTDFGSNTFKLSGSAYLTGVEHVGVNSTFTQSGGTNNALSLSLGDDPSQEGTYNLNGGLLIAPSVKGVTSFGPAAEYFFFGGGTLQASASSAAFLSGLTAIYVEAGGAIIDVQGFNCMIGGPLLHLAAAADGGLTKYGSGTLTLSSSNTFNGKTSIAAGTLTLTNSLALESSTVDTSGGGSLSFGPLTAAALGGLQGSHGLALSNTNAVPVALSVGGNNAFTTLSGNLAGPGSLIKVGNGTLMLSGSDTYSGGTTILAGRLVIANPSAIKDGTLLAVGSTAAFSAPVVPSAVDSGSPATVPEPSTLALLGLGAMLTFSRIRR